MDSNTRRFRFAVKVSAGFFLVCIMFMMYYWVVPNWKTLATGPDPATTRAAKVHTAEMEQKLNHVMFPAVGIISSPPLIAIINPVEPLDDGTPMFLVKYAGASRDYLSQKDLAESLDQIAGRDEPEKVAEMFYWYYYDRWQ
ncbi:hypothetical protein IPJ70_03200 [Candidatus Campbellbacteria bacterium]|nr:MAG: hypothetical protein IPJ70_03200 [Candidatus Campbellbacteria bacterium]